MSATTFVAEQICRVDSRLDRLQLSDQALVKLEGDEPLTTNSKASNHLSKAEEQRVHDLKVLIRSVSAAAVPSAPWASRSQIRTVLRAIGGTDGNEKATDDDTYIRELRWLLVNKAANQVYGQVLQTILDQTLELNDHIWYWDEILTSHRYATLYSIQMSPLRLWQTGVSALRTLQARRVNFSSTWNRFHALVEEMVKVRNLEKLRTNYLSPLAKTQALARSKQEKLIKMKDDAAMALGLLLDVGQVHSASRNTVKAVSSDLTPLTETLDLLETILKHEVINGKNLGRTKQPAHAIADQGALAQRFLMILDLALPEYAKDSGSQIRLHGRPSPLTRYWLPVTAIILSSSTILRILASRKADIKTWLRELGATVVDFWSNWVVDPTKKLIGTIRHDENSEVAIMSKRSLEGDRNSLERMVVDFAVANPEGGQAYTDLQIAEIQAKVREGDLTPVLRAYEKDMAKPFLGAIRGNLIQALLIQIQKTKVDVEVAMGGIDSLLKSQELLFGLIGVTPGILISVAVVRWLNGLFGSRSVRAAGRKQGKTLTVLRRIDRVLSSAELTANGDLSYKDYGLLIIEVYELRQLALQTFPTSVFKEFKIDLDELTNIHRGAARQKDALKRIRWSYKKWY